MFSLSRWFGRVAACGIAASALWTSALCEGQEPGGSEPKAPTNRPGAMLLPPQVSPPPVTSTSKSASVPPPAASDSAASGEKAGELIPAPKVETGVPVVEQPKSAWLDHPIVHPVPRLGWFYVPPKGPGYYSLSDHIHGIERDKAPKSAWPAFALMHPSFFDNDFRYVDDPKYDAAWWEKLHRIHIGDNWLFATGGQAWWRHMHEFNARLTGKTNDYDLLRFRQYGDLWYRDSFRIYAEFIAATVVNQDLPIAKIDENRADFLNLFIDVKLCEIHCRPVYLRVGRQELNIGSTRLISSLDWANTRRTFDGVRAFYLGDKVDVDAFMTHPVIIENARLDHADTNIFFGGTYLTYRPQKGQNIDLYYLYLDNHTNFTTQGITHAPTLVHTLGTRYVGDKCGKLWDFEAAYQLGQRGPADISAGMVSAGLGHNWSHLPMNPTIWGYYEWASGDRNPNAGTFNTFNQLFPFGHYYFGFIDDVGRQNIRDASMHLYLNPAKWITFNAQYHFFSLDAAKDALYGPNSLGLRRSPNGTAGGVVGQELDLLMNFHLGPRSDFLIGYSKLNSGEFISNTGPGRSPELWYLMYNVRW